MVSLWLPDDAILFLKHIKAICGLKNIELYNDQMSQLFEIKAWFTNNCGSIW